MRDEFNVLQRRMIWRVVPIQVRAAQYSKTW